jgi:dephospho-CoA kinase
MESDPELIASIRSQLGDRAYTESGLNSSFIAAVVFEDPKQLKALNALVHPAVRTDFEKWMRLQEEAYVIQEAAILFENNAQNRFDRMILVTAPREERIRRVMSRDGLPREAVLKRMQHQWADARKIPMADYVIENTDLAETRRHVADIHRELLELSGTQEDTLC